jgi:RimJ/RimL family protein N-acetyltransferase
MDGAVNRSAVPVVSAYRPRVAHQLWPLFDLRLRTAEMELRPAHEDDLAVLAQLLPDDLEQDPSAHRFAQVDEQSSRSLVMAQTYWRHYGSWTADAWRLNFVVRLEGELIGEQELEGNDFLTTRTVDTSSWLVSRVRGRGLGKQMRTAVLALAFGPLAAEAAITSAWHDNVASLGVSRALGYQPNGVSLDPREPDRTRADTMVHLRLTRADWLAAGRAEDVTIEGFEPCRPLFGLVGR